MSEELSSSSRCVRVIQLVDRPQAVARKTSRTWIPKLSSSGVGVEPRSRLESEAGFQTWLVGSLSFPGATRLPHQNRRYVRHDGAKCFGLAARRSSVAALSGSMKTVTRAISLDGGVDMQKPTRCNHHYLGPAELSIKRAIQMPPFDLSTGLEPSSAFGRLST